MSQKLARPWRKGDRVRHQDDELTHGQPAHARECQPRADPHVPEQHRQNTDDLAALRCVPLTGTARHERQQRGTITIGNPVHGAFEPNGYVNSSRDIWLLPFTRACFLTSLTFRALRGNHIVTVTLAVYPRLFLSTFHIQSSAWTLGYLKRVVMDVYPRLLEISSL